MGKIARSGVALVAGFAAACSPKPTVTETCGDLTAVTVESSTPQGVIFTNAGHCALMLDRSGNQLGGLTTGAKARAFCSDSGKWGIAIELGQGAEVGGYVRPTGDAANAPAMQGLGPCLPETTPPRPPLATSPAPHSP